MSSFDSNGNYNKTNWKTGDKITADKLNKIEESLEIINNNDIERHKEADERLDALEEQKEAVDERLDELEDLVADNKSEVEELSEQLAQKANIDSVFSMDNMGQDIKEAMTGGSVAVIGKNTILTENVVDGQITFDKLNNDISSETRFVDIKGKTTYGQRNKISFNIPLDNLKQGNELVIELKCIDKTSNLSSIAVQLTDGTNHLLYIPTITNENGIYRISNTFQRDFNDGTYRLEFQFVELDTSIVSELTVYDIKLFINKVNFLHDSLKVEYGQHANQGQTTNVYFKLDDNKLINKSYLSENIDKKKFDDITIEGNVITLKSSAEGGVVKSIELPNTLIDNNISQETQIIKGHKCNLRNNPYGKTTSVIIPIPIGKEYVANTNINIRGKLLHKEQNLTLKRFCSEMLSNVIKYAYPQSLAISANTIYEFDYNIAHNSDLSLTDLNITVDFGDVDDISDLYVFDIEVSFDGEIYSQPNKNYNTQYYDALYVVEGEDNGSVIDDKLEQFLVELERRNNPLYEKSMYVITDSIGGSNESLSHFHGLIAEKNKMTRVADVIWGSTISNGVGAVSPFINRVDDVDNTIKYDYVVIEGFTNDYTRNVPLGETISTDITTYKGALNVLASKLISKFSNARIVFVTPHLHNLTPNENGDTMFDFAQATIDVLSRYSIDVLDMTRNGNIATCYDAHKELYGKSGSSYDIVHCNSEAHKVYATKLEAKLKSL